MLHQSLHTCVLFVLPSFLLLSCAAMHEAPQASAASVIAKSVLRDASHMCSSRVAVVLVAVLRSGVRSVPSVGGFCFCKVPSLKIITPLSLLSLVFCLRCGVRSVSSISCGWCAVWFYCGYPYLCSALAAATARAAAAAAGSPRIVRALPVPNSDLL